MAKRQSTTKAAYIPKDWQWDPTQLTGAGPTNQVQVWSPSGTYVGRVSLDEARAIVFCKAAFIGSFIYICQVAS
jgi:hypothetical protein